MNGDHFRIGIDKNGYQLIQGVGPWGVVIRDRLTWGEVVTICTLSPGRWAQNALDFLENFEYYIPMTTRRTV